MTTVVSPDGRVFRVWVCVALVLAPTSRGAITKAQQLSAGQNINVVGGPAAIDPATGRILGDPYLQRQNEPSLALSSRNPCHLLAGANDYRTVDFPGLPDGGEVGDAWLGVFKSTDCGQTWSSAMLPGFPQDRSAEGLASPLKGLAAGADPTVRPGPAGVFYYSGIAFNRGANEVGKVFVARFVDRNNKESGDPIAYLGTSVIDTGTAGQFLDKPWLVTDIPRTGARSCSIDGRSFAGGNAYLVYSSFVGGTNNLRTKIMFSRSTDCGATWSNPSKLSERYEINQGTTIAIDPRNGTIHVAWREFADPADPSMPDSILVATSTDEGRSFSKAVRVATPLRPFDQGTSSTSFRTNAYPTMVVDGAGRLYIAWAARGYASDRPDPMSGDARIVMTTSPDAVTWSSPQAIDPQPGSGHQFMPALTMAAGRLLLVYYDLREDVSGVFEKYVDEGQIVGRRHTIDVRGAVADPGPAPRFTTYGVADAVDQPSSEISRYLTGTRFVGADAVTRTLLQFNPPNLKLFSRGRVPFIGDYIDVAAPVFAPAENGQWTFASARPGPMVVHAIWADNRDVRKPRDGNWENYTPPLPGCTPGQAGVRNQNIYTSCIRPALIVSAPANAKTLGILERTFVVQVQNTTTEARTFRLRLPAQPARGRASFRQQDLVTELDATVPRLSSITRTVYVTNSTTTPVSVDVVEVGLPGGPQVPGGLQSSTVLNPDIDNPDIDNPDIDNPDIDNPDIDNAEVHNPDIDNPDIDNPDIDNPDIDNPDIDNPDIDNPDIDNHAIANPDIDNPDIDNPDIDNPDIDNPDIDNPDIDNPDIDNSAITDITWKVRNTGNTTSGYRANLFLKDIPSTLRFQLIVRRVYTTPAARECELARESQNQTMVNIVGPRLDDPALRNADVETPAPDIATFFLAPGDEGRITLRVRGRWAPGAFDPSRVAAAVVAQARNNCPEGSAVTPGEIAQCEADRELKPLDIYDPYPPEIAAQDVTVDDTDGNGAEAIPSYPYTVAEVPSGSDVTVACAPAAGTPLPVGATVVTCSATDAGGNTASTSFTVRVRDVTAPAFAPEQNIEFAPGLPAEAEGPSGAVVSYTDPVASDSIDASVTVSCAPVSGSTFPIGTTPVRCVATDGSGNSTPPQELFSIAVIDSRAPIVSVPPPVTGVEAAGPGGATVTYAVTASDIVDGPLTATCMPASGSTFPVGTTTVTCTATDGGGNVGRSSFTVSVVDTSAPAIAVPASVAGVQATGPAGATVIFTATAVDAVSGPAAVTCAPSSGSTFPVGTTVVACTATDGHGNVATASFSVTVVDTLPPVLSLPADIGGVQATSPAGAPVTYSTGAVDLVDGSIAASCTPPSGATFPIGVTTVVCTAADSRGNSVTGSFTVTVVDTMPPALTVSVNPTNIWEPTGKLVPVRVSGTARDGGSGLLAVTFTVLDEYGLVQPSGAIALAPGGEFAFDLLLQASRAGSDRNGRRYTIVVTAVDLRNNRRSVEATVIAVEHDVRK